MVSRLLTTAYWLLATDLAGRCTLGLAFASFSSFLRLVSALATFQTRWIARDRIMATKTWTVPTGSPGRAASARVYL